MYGLPSVAVRGGDEVMAGGRLATVTVAVAVDCAPPSSVTVSDTVQLPSSGYTQAEPTGDADDWSMLPSVVQSHS